MQEWRARARAVALVTLTAAAVAGCGGSDDGDDAKAAKKRAIATLVKADDISEDVETRGRTLAFAGDDVSAELKRAGGGRSTLLSEQCAADASSVREIVAAAQAPQFIVWDGSVVANVTLVFADELQARETSEIYERIETRRCLAADLADVARASLQSELRGAKLGHVTASMVELPGFGESRVTVLELRQPVTLRGRERAMSAEYVVVQEGRAVGVALMTSGGEVPEQARLVLAKRISDRLHEQYG